MNLSHLKKMEIHRFITSNHKVCQHCKRNKSFSSFYDKETKNVNEICNTCNKKINTLLILNTIKIKDKIKLLEVE